MLHLHNQSTNDRQSFSFLHWIQFQFHCQQHPISSEPFYIYLHASDKLDACILVAYYIYSCTLLCYTVLYHAVYRNMHSEPTITQYHTPWNPHHTLWNSHHHPPHTIPHHPTQHGNTAHACTCTIYYYAITYQIVLIDQTFIRIAQIFLLWMFRKVIY